ERGMIIDAKGAKLPHRGFCGPKERWQAHMDKKAFLRKMNEALALEQALIEAEGVVAGRSSVADLHQATGNAIRDDETHLTLLRRIIRDMGGRVEAPAMDDVAWIEALARNIVSTDDELDRLGLLRMLKARAVATGE